MVHRFKNSAKIIIMKFLVFAIGLLFFGVALGQDLKNLDGSISEKESQALVAVGESEGNQMMIDNSSKEYLRVTIISENLYVASLCTCLKSGEVIVMHASAALDDLVYTGNENNMWSTKDTFTWEMREAEMTNEVINKRSQFLKKHGWVANTVSMGNAGETEFFIDRKILSEESIYLAIGLMTESNPEQMIGIPSKTAGDCAAFSLVAGDPVEQYSFDPASWIKVQ